LMSVSYHMFRTELVGGYRIHHHISGFDPLSIAHCLVSAISMRKSAGPGRPVCSHHWCTCLMIAHRSRFPRFTFEAAHWLAGLPEGHSAVASTDTRTPLR
jgi:hypothetical protein